MTLQERNAQILKHLLYNNEGEEFVDLKESFKRTAGYDLFSKEAEEKFPVNAPDFSWKKMKQKLAEADMSSGFTQFLRAGINTIGMAAYETTKTTFEQVATIVPSKLRSELYAPNHGPSFPQEIAEGGLFPECSQQALDLQLINRDFGNLYSVSKNLIEDDQTGQIRAGAAMLGEYLKILQEIYVYGKIASVSGGVNYLNLHVPASETKPSYETAYPWAPAATPLRGGGITKIANTAFGTTALQTAIIQSMSQKNLQSILMQVDPDTLVVSPKFSMDAKVVMNSAFYPAGAQAAGVTGGAFAINILQGALNPIVVRYLPDQNGVIDGTSKRWFILDSKKPGFILQMRQPIAISQEADNSGDSFNRRLYRFQAVTRFNADFLDPRFFMQGSDGTV